MTSALTGQGVIAGRLQDLLGRHLLADIDHRSGETRCAFSIGDALAAHLERPKLAVARRIDR